MDVDEWFKQIRQRYAAHMQCGKGCTACCYGLFDISLADALETARGFRQLPAPLQERVSSRAAELYREIRALRIYEGATEVQKIVIAREMLKQRPGKAALAAE